MIIVSEVNTRSFVYIPKILLDDVDYSWLVGTSASQ